ncbi:MAG: SpoIVB peptidase [Clostridiales bacterium]|nr:SpoIVB peptidase [Clostridiales bacterium]
MKPKLKPFIPFFGMFGISVVLMYFIVNIINFPNQIKLTENIEHKLRFNSPFSATIVSDAINVLKVNNKPVEGNIKVTLNDTLTIESAQACTAQMTLNAFGFPIKRVTLDIMPELEIVPCGLTVGVEINTDGVMVLGTGAVKMEDGSAYSPSEGKLESGDLILDVNGQNLNNKTDLIHAVENSESDLELRIKRDNTTMTTTVSPIKSAADNQKKIGVWVRDATRGIGTITYYNPVSQKFGALGHGILDVDTKKLMTVKNGTIMEARVTDIKKGSKGSPGELVGELHSNATLGQIKLNTPYGIYGAMDLTGVSKITHKKLPIAMQDQVHEGPAVIYSDVDSEIREYDVYIENVNRFSNDETKGMVLRITDPALLRKTNGIVQGMSGSPIIQNDKVIGAITHVFVQDPAKGYGIFIENMLHEENNIY